MSITPTPRTDAFYGCPPAESGKDWQTHGTKKDRDHARQLERELNAAHAECLEQARLNGKGAQREAKLLSDLTAAADQRDRAQDAYHDCMKRLNAANALLREIKYVLDDIRDPLSAYVHGDVEISPGQIANMLELADGSRSIIAAHLKETTK